MIIRRMSEADIHQVSEIEKETFSQPWSAHAFEESVRDDNAVFLVAEDVGEKGVPEIVGYIGMYVSAPEGEITNVAVREECRGNGCGNLLLQAMEQWAQKHRIERIVLEVRSGNAGAIHVYEKNGFVKLGIRKNFYQFPQEDADIMEWKKC